LKKARVITAISIVLILVCASLYGGSSFIAPAVSGLGPGSSGESVADMQQRLANWGYYDGAVNGIFDWKTLMAVRRFQGDFGLQPKGTLLQDTLAAMGLTRLARPGEVYAESGGTSEEQLLARAINGEARGEPYEGQVAVGAVILNRTRDSHFPKTVAGVIYQPGAFTAVSDGQINVPINSSSTVVKAARDALNGWDPTYGCLYYWNPATATSKWIWSRTIVRKIGKHNFGK